MGACVARSFERTKRKVGDSSEHERSTELSLGQVAVIKNNWRKVSGILCRIGKQVLVT